MHQQPVIEAPHLNSLPHASHVDGSFQRSEIYPSARWSDDTSVILSHLLWSAHVRAEIEWSEPARAPGNDWDERCMHGGHPRERARPDTVVPERRHHPDAVQGLRA